MSRWIRRCLIALVVLAGAVVVVVAGWAIDVHSHDGRVLRGVTLAGRAVDGLTAARLGRVVHEVAVDLPTRPVQVRAPGGGFDAEARVLGVVVDERATVDAALGVGREGALPKQFAEWVRSFRGQRRAPVQVSVDEQVVHTTVSERDPGPRTEPTEPTITFRDGEVRAVPGKDGKGIDARDVIRALPTAAGRGSAIVVEVDRGAVEPRLPLAAAEELASDVQAHVSKPLRVTSGGEGATVPVATLRSWVTSEVREGALAPRLDADETLADLRKLLAKAGTPATETRFTVDGGAVRIIAGESGTRCCAKAAVDIVEDLLFGTGATAAPLPAPLDLPLTERPPDLTPAEAENLGVAAPIASFTTRHPGGQPRVSNIHRIADILRGTLILPGKTFSVNDTVGRRTADKGFVSAPVIEEGRFSESIGGGVSQFATTLFNASFEAGLDFGEYQSHSIYISRYPFGREATLSYPAPDLEIKNGSPHGVLIWPTYDATSITVTLYSTKFAEVRQTGQSRAPRGACTRVTTERTRTWLADGRAEVDNVFATYRPAEGVNC